MRAWALRPAPARPGTEHPPGAGPEPGAPCGCPGWLRGGVRSRRPWDEPSARGGWSESRCDRRGWCGRRGGADAWRVEVRLRGGERSGTESVPSPTIRHRPAGNSGWGRPGQRRPGTAWQAPGSASGPRGRGPRSPGCPAAERTRPGRAAPPTRTRAGADRGARAPITPAAGRGRRRGHAPAVRTGRRTGVSRYRTRNTCTLLGGMNPGSLCVACRSRRPGCAGLQASVVGPVPFPTG